MTEQEALHEIMEASVMVLSDKKKFKNAMRVAINDLEEIQQFRELGTVEEVREAVEKQRARPLEEKINPDFPHIGKMFYCSCGVAYLEKGAKYCGNCGKRLE